MGKTIKILKIISFILIMIEAGFSSIFAVFYFNDLFGLQSILDFNIFYMAFVGTVVFDCLFIWITVSIISSLRQKNDLRASDIIGNDIQEAYNFGEIGLVITNESNLVLWTNDLFKDRHLEIIDANILEWKPELERLTSQIDPEETVKVDINNRTYEVKYIVEAGLWIFKDVTDYEGSLKYSKDQAPVVGILTIDNYDDVVRGGDDFNDTVSRVKTAIFNYAKEYGLLLKRVKDDNYFIICNFESFTAVKDDGFSIVDKVRKISSGGGVPLTLSIGFAHDFPDVNKLHELALAALDIAMSRGGDQVVLSTYGHDMEFFGGKSEAQEKRSRVQMRVYADSLIGLIKNASNILVMGHTNMDMDAFGACLGIKSICDRLSKPCKIVAELTKTESKTRSCITSSFSKDELDKIMISPRDASPHIKADTLLIIVDVHTQKMSMAPALLDEVAKIVVIDHHRRAEEYIDSLSLVFNHIDPSSSSTCELIAEFIKFSSINPKIEIPANYATIMLSGIFLDSSFFKSRNTGIRTFEAATILKEFGADNSMADDYLKDDYEERKEVIDIINRIETPEYGVVVAAASQDRLYDNATISKAANELLSLKGNHASFVIGKIGPREIKISGRSDGSINVQKILEIYSGGGGHFTMAACVLNRSDIAEVKKELIAVIKKNLKDATSNYRNFENEEE